MDSLKQWRAEERRFIKHLARVGYTTDTDADPYGWRFATNPMARPLGFRVGPSFLCLHAEYPSGRHQPAAYFALLRAVNRLNAGHWLVRCTLIASEVGGHPALSLRLQANLPMGLPAKELGACLLAWIRESTHIERTSRFHHWVSEDATRAEGACPDVVDDRPSCTP